MSHFVVMVLGDDVEKQLAPYHEFECTGWDNEHVQDVDVTADYRLDFEKYGNEGQDFVAYCESDGKPPVYLANGDKPDFGNRNDVNSRGPHKYGYTEVAAGGAVRVIDRTNPNKKWDWYVEGGRWSKWLIGKSGGHITGGCLGDVDWTAMKADTEKEAGLDWDLAAKVLGKHPPVEPWPSVRERYAGDIEAARTAYHGQPGVKAFRACQERDIRWGSPEDFLIPRDEYLAKRVMGRISPFAFVIDGTWHEKGEMGWFACVSNEKDATQWHSEFVDIVGNLPADTPFTVVDCHI